MCCLMETGFILKNTNRLNIKINFKIYKMNSSYKQVRVDILIFSKLTLKQRIIEIKRDTL